jgi:hypothetical protein
MGVVRVSVAVVSALLGCGRVDFNPRTSTPADSPNDSGASDAPTSTADAFVGVVVGDMRSEQCGDGHAAGLAEASSFVATASGNVTSLSIDYLGGTASQLVLALYDDNSASFIPRTLLATATVAPGGAIAAGVHTAPTDRSPLAQQGQRYWISVFCVGGSCTFRYTYAPGGATNCCFGDTCVNPAPCSASDTSCTVHSVSQSLTVPEATWTPGGAAFGFSVNSYWANSG